MTRPRAADDFAAIRSRMLELERERALSAHTRTGETTFDPYDPPISKRPAPIEEGDHRSGQRAHRPAF